MAETTFYLYKILANNKSYVGYGISERFDLRFEEHNKTFATYGVVGTLVYVKVCRSRLEAFSLEQSIKSNFRCSDLNIPGFKTEHVGREHLEPLLDFIKSFDFNQPIDFKIDDFSSKLEALKLPQDIYSSQLIRLLEDKDKTQSFMIDLFKLCKSYGLGDSRGLLYILDKMVKSKIFWPKQVSVLKLGNIYDRLNRGDDPLKPKTAKQLQEEESAAFKKYLDDLLSRW